MRPARDTNRIIACAALLALGACGEEGTDRASSRRGAAEATALAGEPIQPLEAPEALDPRMVELGNLLFNDPRLSADGTVACASCHVIAEGGDDGRARSVGIRRQLGGINAPTVINSGLNFVQFWDGRAATLEEQAEGPVAHPKEMGARWDDVVRVIAADSNYARRFAALFRDGVTKANVTRAIATFERTLVAVDSPFDRWLRGDQSALDADEVAGYELFKSVGCIACHQGRNVGGNMYQRFGVLGDYFRDRGQLTDEDRGRFNVTQDESDRFVFRVPSLRMVEHTAPYFHDGSAATLQDAVRVMVRYQLGRRLADEEIARIVRFLRTLDGPMPRAIPPQIGPLELPSSAGAR